MPGLNCLWFSLKMKFVRLCTSSYEKLYPVSLDASLSQNIVSSSYAVLSLVEIGGVKNMLTAQKAIRWIANHRNENGGFISTQVIIWFNVKYNL